MTPSEEFVYNLCEKSFLSLWSFANPKRLDNNKELCDALIVNIPDVLIFSVKQIHILAKGDEAVEEKRWKKRAIEDSVKQIYGAEKAIKRKLGLQDHRGRNILLPELDEVKVWRIAVAIGRGDFHSIIAGEFGNGFIHVFDEESLFFILRELDTITDFLEYLQAKEKLTSQSKLLMESEQDQLGYYLLNERTFPKDKDLIIFERGIWEEYKKTPEHNRKKSANEISYTWDKFIEHFIKYELSGTLIYEGKYSDMEPGLRTLSRESRFSRRMLVEILMPLLDTVSGDQIWVRTVPSQSGVLYIYIIFDVSKDDEDRRNHRKIQMYRRALVARHIYQDKKTVIALGLNPAHSKYFCEDLLYLHFEEWTEENASEALKIQKEFGYYQNQIQTQYTAHEFPPE